MKPTAAEQAACDLVTAQIRAVIKHILPRLSTEVFGSQRTGLALSTSDIDIRLFDEDTRWAKGTRPSAVPRDEVRTQLNEYLDSIMAHLLKHPDFVLIQKRHARYPLLTLQHRESGFDIQVVCSNDTSQSRDITQTFLKEEPDLHAIFAVLKVMLDIRGLNDVYRGGAGSYTLFMMIALSFRHRQDYMRGASLGDKFKDILNFYEVFKTYSHALALKTSELESIWPKLPLAKARAKEQQERAKNDIVSPPATFLF
jgi:non-canonical poly(A) RNA polymerase PAPD5/7